MSAFVQIGEACGGFIEAAPETVDKAELTEVLIKVKVNYTGFLPAFIKIYDEEGRDFTIHTVTHLEERWLRERNPRIHGSFTRNAAESFNEYNPHAEQYTFDRNLAVVSQKDSSETSKSRNYKMNTKIGTTKIIKNSTML